MSVNKYKPHVYIIPEDDANRQLAGGFIGHEAVADRAVDMRDPSGGWIKALEIFDSEYLRLLRANGHAHVVVLIDFDGRVEDRRTLLEKRIPEDVNPRVFVVGAKDEPESLRRELKMSAERTGRELAQDCLKDDLELWRHPQLVHNSAELARMVRVIKPFLFETDYYCNKRYVQ